MDLHPREGWSSEASRLGDLDGVGKRRVVFHDSRGFYSHVFGDEPGVGHCHKFVSERSTDHPKDDRIPHMVHTSS